MLALYFLHETSAAHQKQLTSLTQSPHDVFFCEQVVSVVGLEVGGINVLVLLLLVVVKTVVLGDEFFERVGESGVVEGVGRFVAVAVVVEMLLVDTQLLIQITTKIHNTKLFIPSHNNWTKEGTSEKE